LHNELLAGCISSYHTYSLPQGIPAASLHVSLIWYSQSLKYIHFHYN